MENYDIRTVHGHYEVYKNGSFISSADTLREARADIDIHMSNITES